MAKKTTFFCKECGYETSGWMGKCPGCNGWNTLEEELMRNEKATSRSFVATTAKPTPLNEVDVTDYHRFPCGIRELDRVLGGGVVRGSLILVGGDPGIGKSTLLLQV